MARSRRSAPTTSFPERLRQTRFRRGLSQGELADRAKIPGSAVSHFESGTRKPSFDNLKRVADALEVTADYLLGRVDEETAFAGADELYRDIDNLTAEDRDFARRMVADLARRNIPLGKKD